MKSRNIMKYLAISFLSICLLVLALVLFAGSNWGLRSAAYFANKADGITIEGIQGSLYSEFEIAQLQIDIEDGVRVDGRSVKIDIGLKCALDLAACLRNLSVNSLDITLPVSSDEASEPSENEYIKLPVPVDIDSITINQFTLSQRVKAGTEVSVQRVLRINALSLSDMAFFKRLDLKQIAVEAILLYANENAEATNVEQEATVPFTLQGLQTQLEKAPTIELPQIFIPINASIQSIRISRLCWQVQDTPEDKNCIALKRALIDVEQQNIKAELSVLAQATFKNNGLLAEQVDLQAHLNIAENWTHDVNVKLLQGASDNKTQTLSLNINGTLDETKLDVQTAQNNATQNLLSLRAQLKLDESSLPIILEGEINELSSVQSFLREDIDSPLRRANFSVNGDWSDYKLLFEAELSSAMSELSGLTSIRLLANVSPGNQILNISELSTKGELGDTLLSGKTSLVTLPKEQNVLALDSDAKLILKKLNLGVFNPELRSDISGDFSFVHVFTEKWMRGELNCNKISGAYADYPLSAACEVFVSKSGELNIKRFTLNQGDSRVNAKGKVQLPHTEYLRLNAQDMMNAAAQLNFDMKVPDASQFDAKFEGMLNLRGDLKGKLGKPEVVFTAEANAIKFDNIALDTAFVDFTLDAKNNFSTKLEVKLGSLAVDNTEVLQSSDLNFDGNQNEHTLVLNVKAKEFSAQNEFIGGLTINEQVTRWEGSWREGNIVLPFTQLNLDNPANIVADITAQAYSVSDHCWLPKTDGDSICLSNIDFNDGLGSAMLDVVYDIASVARHYSPEMVLPDTSLPLKSKVLLDYSQPKGLNLQAYNSIIGGILETSRHTLDLTAIIANFTLEDNVLSSIVHAGSERTGLIGLRSQIDLRPEQRTHAGRVAIDNFDLNLFQRFVPSTKSILGMVNADIGFEGPLEEPSLSGTLSVSSGELILDAYTYPLTDFQHDMTFAGKTSKMEGGFQLGKGKGRYTADIDFSEGFSIDGTLSGNDMQFAFADSKAQISPDIAFTVTPSDLNLKGSISIPSAEVKITELPENAKTPSSDTIIIGQKPPEPIVPLAMDIDLNILIDKAKRGFVTVDALDLEATLSGDLKLNVQQKRSKTADAFQPMRTTLNGQINVLDGSYEAYGQMLVIQSGRIFFNGEPSLPQFDIRAIRNPLNIEGDVVAGLHVTGNPVLPKVELFSEPPMTQAVQLSYLLQGRDISKSNPNGGSGTDAALLNALVGFGVSKGENRIGQLGTALGFDSLSLQTAGAGDKSQVQITGRIAEDIQITYGVGVMDQASEIILKYQIMPQLFIEAKSGLNSALDLFYQVSRGGPD